MCEPARRVPDDVGNLRNLIISDAKIPDLHSESHTDSNPNNIYIRVSHYTLFSLTIGGVLLSFGIVAPMKSTVVQNWTNSPLWRPSGVDLEPQG